MMKHRGFQLILVVVVMLAACTGKTTKQNTSQPILKQDTIEKTETSTDNSESHPGKQVFNTYCITCHQADGSGVPGMYPSLWDAEWIGNRDTMIHIALYGQSGEIEVDGEIYNNLMPAHNHLSDQEIADVLSYIRVSFGNNFEAVTKEEVAAAREQ